MYDTWQALVQRPDLNTPWGLRLTGGADCFQPLSVAQVRKRSLADKAGLKVGDLVTSIEGIATEHLTHRQVIDIIGSQRLALTFEIGRCQSRDAMSATSSVAFQPAAAITNADNRSLATHGLLAYLPISPSNTVDMATFSPIDGPSTFKPSYHSPPFRAQNNGRALKSYQPFDMSGKNAVPCAGPPKTKIFYTIPAQSPQPSANTFYHTALPIQPSVNTFCHTSPSQTEVNTFYHTSPPPPALRVPVRSSPQHPYNNHLPAHDHHSVTSPVAATSHPIDSASSYYSDVSARPSVLQPPVKATGAPRDNAFWSTRTSYYSDDREQSSCAQSRSFFILESVLNEQGSGEKGLPAPLPRTGAKELEETPLADQQPVIIGIHPTTRPPADHPRMRPADHPVSRPAEQELPVARLPSEHPVTNPVEPEFPIAGLPAEHPVINPVEHAPVNAVNAVIADMAVVTTTTTDLAEELINTQLAAATAVAADASPVAAAADIPAASVAPDVAVVVAAAAVE